MTSQPEGHRPDEVSAAAADVVDEPRLTAALRRAEDLRWVASRSRQPRRDVLRLIAMFRDEDDLSAIAALHAVSAMEDPIADQFLLEIVEENEAPFAGHAAWALGARRSSPAATAALGELVSRGGFPAMLAERTLIEWSRRTPRATVTDLDLSDPPLADLRHRRSDGIVVVQPFLHARIDRAGTDLGVGDAGGIASLLRSLGTSLAGLPDIDHVITVTRRHLGEARSEELAPGHRVERVEVGPDGAMPWREGWVHRTRIERQLLEIGHALAGRRVVWHLRMADVGTLAAAAVARRLGQPVVFTAAPDPHIVIDALQENGRLDRSKFGVEDAAAQYWFRARMVERLTAQSDRVVLLPRATIRQELVELVGVEPRDLDHRATVVPEGVDLAEIERARHRLAARGPSPAVRRVLDALPAPRRDLPWMLTVGRLHPSKGPQRIVEAVANDPELAGSVNVVVVGGDLRHPSPDEQSTIERIRLAARGSDPALVTLTGHLAPAAVSDLLAHLADHGGVYVSASDKEEFGLAIVEALAAGAVVVAPERGGPRTYIDDGDTGILCDTLSIDALRVSMVRALGLVDRPGRAERARGKARDELGIEQMAERLGDLYRDLLPARVPA